MQTYLNTTSKTIKQNQALNDKDYKAPPLHPALLIQDTKLTESEIKLLARILYTTTNTKPIRIALPNNKIKLGNIDFVTLVNPLPGWTKPLTKLPYIKNAIYASLDFKKLGNFVISVGTGPNLFIVPPLTAFHIAILNTGTKLSKNSNYALIRPEIVVVKQDKALYSQISTIRQQALGKPTLYINDFEDIDKITKRAINIYNKMPFRWVDDLKAFKQVSN